MTRYGRSPWIDGFPKSRIPSYPRHTGHLDTDVVIVGGGLTGCTTAYAFAAQGIKVALVEADQIGRRSSGASSGWIAEDPGIGFFALEKAIGLRKARHALQAWRRAALDFSALLRRLDVKCHLERRDGVLVALTAEQAPQLKREQRARRAAGFGAPALTPRAIAADLGLSGLAAIRTHDSATVDPYRTTLGIAAAAVERGARLFERSPVTRITFGSKAVDAQTARGTLRAGRIIVATGAPTPLFHSLARHFRYRRVYSALTEPVTAKVRAQLGRRAAVVRDTASPAHLVRWVGDERILVSGADLDASADRLRDKLIVQRTGQLMYELSTLYPDISGLAPEFGWDAAYARTAEGLPYIGPHRNFPRHLFAFGDAGHSLTGAYLASRVLLRHFLAEPDASDEAFAFTR